MRQSFSTECVCVFKVITLVWANQGNYFENANACSKCTMKTTVATQLKVTFTFYVLRYVTLRYVTFVKKHVLFDPKVQCYVQFWQLARSKNVTASFFLSFSTPHIIIKPVEWEVLMPVRARGATSTKTEKSRVLLR